MPKDYLASFHSLSVANVEYVNVLCVHDDELGGPRSPSEFLDEFDSWLTAKYRAILPTTVVLGDIRAFQIPSVFGADTEAALKLKGLAGTGMGADGLLPREATLTLSFRSNHTSRRSMGRISLPSPLASNALDGDGNWRTSATYWVNAGLLGDALLAGHDIGVLGADGHLSLRVYSRANHQQGTGDKTTDVTTYIRRPRPRWVRRRVSSP